MKAYWAVFTNSQPCKNDYWWLYVSRQAKTCDPLFVSGMLSSADLIVMVNGNGLEETWSTMRSAPEERDERGRREAKMSESGARQQAV